VRCNATINRSGGNHKLEHDLVGDVWFFFSDLFQNIPPGASHQAAAQQTRKVSVAMKITVLDRHQLCATVVQ
jgi:hypothetical protein